jgi:hypothetical protein
MSSPLFVRRSLFAILALALVPVAPAAEPAHRPSNKWRLVVDGTARSAGDVSFRVTPNGGTPVEVSVKVPVNHGENAIAHDLRDAFRAKLPNKQFHIEVDDGEDVLLKKHIGQPDFLVEFVSSTVENTRFKLERE